MIEFNQLEHLVSIAKNKTISKAAEELLISQPGLTRSMQRLEDDLGLSLFNRKKNKIELNENGKLAVEFAQKLLDGREEMIKELTKMSALPNFRSNITIQREEAEDNRILIPITDPEAHVRYYAIYPKDKRNVFQPIIKQIKNIDWKKTKELSK